MILQINSISKSFGVDPILKDIQCTINERDKVALVGVNGAGKTTLFRLITGELLPDSGQIILAKDQTLGYLQQNALTESDRGLYEEARNANTLIIDLQQQLSIIEKDIHDHRGTEDELYQLNAHYDRLRTRYEQMDGYQYESLVRGVLRGLGFDEEDFMKPVSTLSGGQKTRVALAMTLIRQPDLLMLDEPTNHLDIDTCAWLEDFLRGYRGTLLVISHDRYFLDRVTNRTIELQHGQVKDYRCSYSDYMEKKLQDEIVEQKHYEQQQKTIKKQEAVIEQLRSFNREKSIKRAESREKQLAKIELLDKPQSLDAEMRLHLKPRTESGNDVLSVRDIAKAFGDLELFRHLSFEIKKGEKVALLGDNGTGKSTLFKILNSILTADSGTFRQGARVQVGYYDQEHQLLNPSNNLIDEISDAYPAMDIGAIRSILAAYLFRGEDVFKQVASLSGGEKGRLTLLKLMLSEANFLMLDEPTNHLDILSKSILEKALKGYEGTLFFISHDRYFINAVADRVLYLTHGQLESYLGNYDHFMEKHAQQRVMANNTTATLVNTSERKLSWEEEKNRKAERRKLEKQLEQTESRIHELEAAIEACDKQLNDPVVYTDHVLAGEIADQKSAYESELESCYETWEEIHQELNE